MTEQTTDFVKLLPRTLQRRFEGLGSYVTAILEEREITGLLPEERELIQFLVFIRSLEAFLLDGHRAAEMAVTTFAGLGIKAFNIGQQSFSEGSDAVLRGKHLAQALRAAIQDPALLQLMDDAPSLKDLILTCALHLRSAP